ncbi:alpha/beta hydrolase [Streptomyces montanisoli]|uniref:Esterase n=1 Tax=Streptomyces montanisoli TaxID=2798581 RepID=A0A940MBP9_9ACTN|nr:alpha/beta hydrolase-fold protein [Streptomyces montanisoli]MBP0460005.1 esterase [Streptomyces montanisoli]
MGLTSHKVLAVAVFAAVVLFALTVWRWPHLARRGVRPVLGRVGLLFATQVAIFAAVALVANRSFLFYASWDDLFGRETGMGTVLAHDTNPSGVVTAAQTPISAGIPLGGPASRRGLVRETDIAGPRSHIVSAAYVYLPPQYFQPRYKHHLFPAAIVLTGYPGAAKALVSRLDYPTVARAQAAAHRMEPMVLVMLRPTVAPPRDTECVDVPHGPQTETYFARDIPDVITHSYRVGPGLTHWGIIGDSTGGYCALKIAMHHPHDFGAAVGLSAYYKAAEDTTTGDLFHGDETLRHQADLMWMLHHENPPGTSLLVTTSRHGEKNLASTQRFIAAVKAPARVSSIILPSGGHNYNTWKREIPAALVWMGKRLD